MLKDTNVDVLKLDMKFIEMNVENRQKGIRLVRTDSSTQLKRLPSDKRKRKSMCRRPLNISVCRCASAINRW